MKTKYVFIFLFCCSLVTAYAQLGQSRPVDCTYSKEITIPFNYLNTIPDMNTFLNQVVNYSDQDEFSYWYKITAKEDTTIYFRFSAINDSDSYLVYIYQYNQGDFCNKLYTKKIKPLAHSFYVGKGSENQTLEKSQHSLEVKKENKYYISILNMSLNNCGHYFNLNYGNDTLKMNVIHTPCKKNNKPVSSRTKPLIKPKDSLLTKVSKSLPVIKNTGKPVALNQKKDTLPNPKGVFVTGTSKSLPTIKNIDKPVALNQKKDMLPNPKGVFVTSTSRSSQILKEPINDTTLNQQKEITTRVKDSLGLTTTKLLPITELKDSLITKASESLPIIKNTSEQVILNQKKDPLQNPKDVYVTSTSSSSQITKDSISKAGLNQKKEINTDTKYSFVSTSTAATATTTTNTQLLQTEEDITQNTLNQKKDSVELKNSSQTNTLKPIPVEDVSEIHQEKTNAKNTWVCLVKDGKKKHLINANLTLIDLDNKEYLPISNSSVGEWFGEIEPLKNYKLKCISFGYKDLEQMLDLNKDTLELFLEPLKVGDNFVMKSIYFHPNTFALKKESNAELQRLLNYLLENSEVNIEIQGHTNGDNKIFKNKAYKDLGEEWNFQGSAKNLSLKRAETIKNYLVANGISTERLVPEGYGGSKSIIKDPETMEEVQKNVRVEVVILKN